MYLAVFSERALDSWLELLPDTAYAVRPATCDLPCKTHSSFTVTLFWHHSNYQITHCCNVIHYYVYYSMLPLRQYYLIAFTLQQSDTFLPLPLSTSLPASCKNAILQIFITCTILLFPTLPNKISLLCHIFQYNNCLPDIFFVPCYSSLTPNYLAIGYFSVIFLFS